MHALVRKSSFSKAQGLRETGSWSPAVYTKGHCYAFNFPHSRIRAVGLMPYQYYIDMNS